MQQTYTQNATISHYNNLTILHLVFILYALFRHAPTAGKTLQYLTSMVKATKVLFNANFSKDNPNILHLNFLRMGQKTWKMKI